MHIMFQWFHMNKMRSLCSQHYAAFQAFWIIQQALSNPLNIWLLTSSWLHKKKVFFARALQSTWQNIIWWFLFSLLWILSFHRLETQSTRLFQWCTNTEAETAVQEGLNHSVSFNESNKCHWTQISWMFLLKVKICEYTLEIFVFGKYETDVCCICITVTSS
jgi:hypothetical protein